MPRFSLVPADNRQQAIDVQCMDGSGALHASAALPHRELHVFEEESYLFSVRKWGIDCIFWEIFRSDTDRE